MRPGPIDFDTRATRCDPLYVLPVGLVAVELGWRWGLGAAALAFALYVAWSLLADVDLNALGYPTRALVLFAMGGVLGQLAARARAAGCARVTVAAEHPRAARRKESTVKSWHVTRLDLKPRLPEILSSTPEARVIALDLRAGESLPDHEVHERAWVVVIDGEVEITSANGEHVFGGDGPLVEIAAAERHEVFARSDARLLLLLTPWPGVGHPGAMTLP